jgi:hypothetical protein
MTDDDLTKSVKKPRTPRGHQRPLADSTVLAILASKKDKARTIYIEYGPGRTIGKIKQAVIDAVGPISESSLKHWCSQGKWLEAASEYDLKAAEADHAVIAKWKEVLRTDPVAAMELARALQIELLVNGSSVMKPQDKKALSQTIKDLTTVIEVMRSPDSSLSRDKATRRGPQTNVSVAGDLHVHNRAIALLEKAGQTALPKPTQVIDVASTQVPDAKCSEEHVKEPAVLSSAPVQPEPAAAPAPVVQQKQGKRVFGVDIRRLAEVAAKDKVSFAEALSRLTRDT